jgi:hypothetical protein
MLYAYPDILSQQSFCTAWASNRADETEHLSPNATAGMQGIQSHLPLQSCARPCRQTAGREANKHCLVSPVVHEPGAVLPVPC